MIGNQESRKSRKISPTSKDLANSRHKLEEIVDRYFPGKFRILETCLSVKAIELIDGVSLPFALILVANPGSGKSTILYTVESIGNCYSTKNFTSKSFVSHMANTSEEELKEIDLLPKIKNKTLITSELAPIFSGKDDFLKETLGVLTSVLDGKGYSSESGSKGHRGYDEDIFFTWIGAVVEISTRVWNLIGFMGPKMYFLRIDEDSSSLKEKREKILRNINGKKYAEKQEDIAKETNNLWSLVKKHLMQNNGKIIWDESKDNHDALDKIVMMAQIVGCLRAYLPTNSTEGTSGSNYGYEKPIVEDAERASHAFYNLARGHAVLYGRNYITDEDLKVVIDVALSSASRERTEMLKLLIKNDGFLTSNEIVQNLKVSLSTALRKCKELEMLGLVDGTTFPSTTKPSNGIKLKEEFEWLTSEEFSKYNM